MTSVVLPQLKRTMTDIMDEELYQIPTSPLIPSTSLPQINSASSSNNFYLQPQSSQPQNSSPIQNNLSLNLNNNYNHHTSNKNSVNSSPSLQQQQLYNNNMYHNNSQNNLGDMLNLPDSFIEQFTSQYYLDYLKSQQQQQQQLQQQQQQQPQYSEYLEAQDTNPFINYSNSNTYIKPTQNYPFQQQENSPPPLPQAFPPRRRKRITTIDSLEPTTSNKKKTIDEDYLLYNPDISPGHVITENEMDSCFYVPPNEFQNEFLNNEPQNFENDIIPGYEDDYLYLDDANEQIEEDLSDDEDENEENYFQVDEEFDDYIMNNTSHYNNNQTFDEFKNISLEDNNQNINQGLPHALQELHDEAVAANNHAIVSEVSPQSIISTPPPMDSPPEIKQEESEDDSIMIDNDDQDYQQSETSDQPQPPEISEHYRIQEQNPNLSPTKRQHTRSAQGTGAEITATNPDHRCSLISPTTGLICNKQFSRPYDLIRHQNTIHASMKKIFRCVICEGRYKGGKGNGKEKTFSRGDALSRHIKIKHELVGEEALELINDAKRNVEYHPVHNVKPS
ncbi:RPN4 [Candida pseudojiufengensis]|uniref:RPN4 n=1 Tax=Candida pseudojiufengensis TaxID=497109 RepID=UPI0022249441|nr:RPN4 [Candida pseudojiufengensis]KAI5960333.1 RPN4 [Candida pseudojiufengensis]